MGATVLPHERGVQGRDLFALQPVRGLSAGGLAASRRLSEWLDYCEDLIFDIRLRELYGPSPFVPQAPSTFSPVAAARLFQAILPLCPRRWQSRPVAEAACHSLPHLPGSRAGTGGSGPIEFAGLVACADAGGRVLHRNTLPPTRTATERPRPVDRLRALIWVPIIRVVGDLAKMLGYPVGLAWRRQNRHRPGVDWRRWAPDPQIDATPSTGQPPE